MHIRVEKNFPKAAKWPKVLSPHQHFPKAPEVRRREHEVKVSKTAFTGRAEKFGLAGRETHADMETS